LEVEGMGMRCSVRIPRSWATWGEDGGGGMRR